MEERVRFLGERGASNSNGLHFQLGFNLSTVRKGFESPPTTSTFRLCFVSSSSLFVACLCLVSSYFLEREDGLDGVDVSGEHGRHELLVVDLTHGEISLEHDIDHFNPF